MRAVLIVLATLISCAPVSYAGPIKFFNNTDLGTWLASNGFNCVPHSIFCCALTKNVHIRGNFR